MEVSVKNNGELGRKVYITLPAEVVKKSFNKQLRNTSKKIRLPGFRSGKVPPKLIEELHGQKIFQDVTQDLIEKSYQDAITEKKLKPAGVPDIKEVNTTLGEDLEVIANIEVFPEFEPALLEGEVVEKITATVQESDVEDFLMKIRRQRGQWQAVERPAQEGDRVKVQIHSETVAKLFGHKADKPIDLIIGEIQTEGDFNEKLKGAKPKDQITAHAKIAKIEEGKFGKLLQSMKLRKQHRLEASQMTIETVEEPQLAEIDKDFFTYFGFKEENLEELKKALREGMEKRLAQTIKNSTRDRIIQLLVEKNPISLPKVLVANEIASLRESLLRSANIQASENKERLKDDLFRERAEYNVRSFLVVDKIAEQQKFDVDNNAFERKLNELTSVYEDAEKAKSYYRRNRQARHSVRMMILQDQVLDLLTKNISFKEKSCPVQELIGFSDSGSALPVNG